MTDSHKYNRIIQLCNRYLSGDGSIDPDALLFDVEALQEDVDLSSAQTLALEARVTEIEAKILQGRAKPRTAVA